MRCAIAALSISLWGFLSCNSDASDQPRTASQGTLATTSSDNPWPQWRGPNRDGKSIEKGLLNKWPADGPPVAWKNRGFGKGYAGVSVVGDRVYTTGNLDEGQAAIAASTKDGKVIWRRVLTKGVPKHGYGGSRCTPSVDGDRLYVVTSDGSIACLRTKDGEQVWKKNFGKQWSGKMMSGWGYSESPLVDGDRVLCTPGGNDAIMVALDKRTGKEIWRTKAPSLGRSGRDGAGYSSIVISNAGGVKQYVQLTGRGLIGVAADDGRLLWNYNRIANGTANIPTPIVDGDLVFGSTGYGTGAALLSISARGSKLAAKEEYFLDAKTMQNHHGGIIKIGDYLYCGHGHNKGFPLCVEMKSGKIAWGPERGEGSGSAAVTYADGHLYFRYQDGTMALIEANSREYKIKGSFKIGIINGKSWPHPVIADGLLYLRDQDEMIVYDVRKK